MGLLESNLLGPLCNWTQTRNMINVGPIRSMPIGYLLIFRLQLSILHITSGGWRPCLRILFRIMVLSRPSFALAGYALVNIHDPLRILNFDLSNTFHLRRPYHHLWIQDARLQPKSKWCHQMTRVLFVLSTFRLHVDQIQIASKISLIKCKSGSSSARSGSNARRTTLGWTQRNGVKEYTDTFGVLGKLSTSTTTRSIDQKGNLAGMSSILSWVKSSYD